MSSCTRRRRSPGRVEPASSGGGGWSSDACALFGQPLGSSREAEALVLQGMGGLHEHAGSRLLVGWMPTYQRVVWFGRVDLTKFRKLMSKVMFRIWISRSRRPKMLAQDEVDLAVRLRWLFDGPLRQIPCLVASMISSRETFFEERDRG